LSVEAAQVYCCCPSDGLVDPGQIGLPGCCFYQFNFSSLLVTWTGSISISNGNCCSLETSCSGVPLDGINTSGITSGLVLAETFTASLNSPVVVFRVATTQNPTPCVYTRTLQAGTALIDIYEIWLEDRANFPGDPGTTTSTCRGIVGSDDQSVSISVRVRPPRRAQPCAAGTPILPWTVEISCAGVTLEYRSNSAGINFGSFTLYRSTVPGLVPDEPNCVRACERFESFIGDVSGAGIFNAGTVTLQ
jgi:hypothetical protein